MFLELCRVTTSDGVVLEGMLERPVGGKNPYLDAVLLIHGTGSHFAAGGVLERFSRQCVLDRISTLRINTRGHDLLCNLPTVRNGIRGSLRGGAAVEQVDEAPRDIAAWLALLVAQGFHRVALVGHSMGGVKALLAAAAPELEEAGLIPHVVGVIGVSPPRFCHDQFWADPAGEPFRTDFARAQALIAAGQGETLIEVTQPLPLLITAAGFVRKYGPEDSLDYVRVLSRVAKPVLIVLGGASIESSAAFRGLPDTLETLQLPHVRVDAVPGAGITYAGSLDAPFERMQAWLPTL